MFLHLYDYDWLDRANHSFNQINVATFIREWLPKSAFLTSSSRKTLKWNSPDQDNWVIVVVTRCCALHRCWWCIAWPLGTMGGPTPLLWTTPCPWRPPNIILRSSREHFLEMFLIWRRDDRGSKDRSYTIDNSCVEVVLRWLSSKGTPQEIFSFIWRHSTAPPTCSFVSLPNL